MEPRERARRPRSEDPPAGDDDRDDLPWLQDEKPSSPRPVLPPKPVAPPKAQGRGPWWGRLIGGDTELRAAAPAQKKGAAVGRVRPFEGPADAETVVASRDELLRAVREYMGGRSSPILDAAVAARGGDPVTPPAPRAGPAVVRHVPRATPIDDLETAAEGDPDAAHDSFETRRMKAPLVPPRPPASDPLETRKMKAPLIPRPVDPEASPTDDVPRPSQRGDVFDMIEARRVQAAGDRPVPADAADAPSAMSRERVLPTSGRPKRRVERQETAEPSMSSFSLGGEDARDRTPYPADFMTPGLRLLSTRQWGAALDYYREEARRNPNDTRHMFGQAAALLSLDRLEEAAPFLVKAHELDPVFPMARLISEACPDDPVTWYNLAAALVAERNRSAYLCAEAVLTELLGGADDDQLRGRAQRVQRNIAQMLEQRSMRDEMHLHEEKPWHSSLRRPAVLAGIVLALVAALLLWRALAPSTSPSVPQAAPSAAPSPSARIVASPLPVKNTGGPVPNRKR